MQIISAFGPIHSLHFANNWMWISVRVPMLFWAIPPFSFDFSPVLATAGAGRWLHRDLATGPWAGVISQCYLLSKCIYLRSCLSLILIITMSFLQLVYSLLWLYFASTTIMVSPGPNGIIVIIKFSTHFKPNHDLVLISGIISEFLYYPRQIHNVGF